MGEEETFFQRKKVSSPPLNPTLPSKNLKEYKVEAVEG